MRTGSEQFILKDFPFYDAMVTPALGITTVFVYEVLRRYIWRSLERGSDKKHQAIRSGKLVASISRSKVALMTGLSVRQIQYDINRLREVGWVHTEDGRWTGETLLYELGTRDRYGTEAFYADGDLRELWLALEQRAEDQELDSVSKLSCEDRLAFTKAWFEDVAARGVVQPVHTPCATVALPPAGGSATTALRIGEPCGAEESEKSEKYGPPPASGIDSTAAAEPGDRLRDNQVRRGRKNATSPRPNVIGRFPSDQDEEQEPEFAIDSASDSGDDGEVRRQRVEALVGDVLKKADAQRDDNDTRRAKKVIDDARAQQLKEAWANEQRAENLKGRSWPHAVTVAAKKAWQVYTDLLRDRDPRFPIVQWKAEGNGKARGQIYKLVDMYGGETVELAVRYVVENWEKIGARYFKNPGGIPNIGLLVSLHEPLFREAVLWGEHREVLEEWARWYKEHPEESAPYDLKDRYAEASKSLAALGFGA